MRRDLCNALLQRHPRIFANPEGHGDAAGDLETRVGDGWYTLLDVLCTDLQYESDQEGAPQVHATQIKEKFGRLRFRVDDASERQRAMIRLAESLSEYSCETCGAPADELSIIEHAPKCERHFYPSHGTRQEARANTFSRLRQFLDLRLTKFRAKSARRTNHQATMELFAAIRADDTEGVRQALRNKPSLQGLAMYRDGCYRPLDLALKMNNDEIVNLLKNHAP